MHTNELCTLMEITQTGKIKNKLRSVKQSPCDLEGEK